MMSLIFVARPGEHKGLKVLLEALSIVRCPRWQLQIVGDISVADRARLKGASELHSRIVQHGAVPNAQVAGLMRDADILIVPSFYENFGNVALEGMASGCIVIASRTGGLIDLVEEGDTGWLFDPGDSSQLAIALDLCLTQPTWCDRASIKAMAKAKNYSWDRIAALTYDLLSAMAAQDDQ